MITVNKYLEQHRKFYLRGLTRSISFRMKQLRKLKNAIKINEKRLCEALQKDLGKSELEAYATEIGYLYNSINYTVRHLSRWAKPVKVRTPMYLQPSRSYILNEPYGTVLIIGPFNYPFQLLIEPLIGAIASGNCIVLKPSEHTPNVARVVGEIIQKTFPRNYIRVIQGGVEATSQLIHAPFDYIFFTGSVKVGKIVMEAAAKNLTPVTLELGGKSPVIVEKTANLDIAAKRIAWGKFINAGQTCIAPDYLLVDASIKERLIQKITSVVKDFYGKNPQESKDYGRIVNEQQFDRLVAIVEAERNQIIYGGRTIRDKRFIEPTLIAADDWASKAMEEELFGPILPIIGFKDIKDAIQMIQTHPKPLALYLFTEDIRIEKSVLRQISFGGGCINDTISHVANHHLPFGGVGNSGIGAYHGKYSFDLFSHQKSMLKKSTRFESGLTFPPYNNKVKLIRKIMK